MIGGRAVGKSVGPGITVIRDIDVGFEPLVIVIFSNFSMNSLCSTKKKNLKRYFNSLKTRIVNLVDKF